MNAQQQILYNRGIPIEDQDNWLNSNQKNISDWRLLDNVEKAVDKIVSALKNKRKTIILQDCD